MISHLSLGVRDLDRAQSFYDALGAPLGFVRLWRSNGGLGYGPEGGNDKLALFERADGVLAAGPGFHLALRAPSREAVHAAHAVAIVQGGSDEGAPGPRPHCGATYYAAFLRDPDGHKLEIVHQ